MRRPKYVKISTDFFEQENILTIEKHKESSTIILFWLEMLFKSRRINGKNLFYLAKDFEITPAVITSIFEISETQYIEYAALLEKLGMIKVNECDIEVFRFWEGNQRDRGSKEYKQWRSEVFKRDKYICQHCKRNGGLIQAHHIKSFSKYKELRFEVSNGITLCEECHKEEHKKRRSMEVYDGSI